MSHSKDEKVENDEMSKLTTKLTTKAKTKIDGCLVEINKKISQMPSTDSPRNNSNREALRAAKDLLEEKIALDDFHDIIQGSKAYKPGRFFDRRDPGVVALINEAQQLYTEYQSAVATATSYEISKGYKAAEGYELVEEPEQTTEHKGPAPK